MKLFLFSETGPPRGASCLEDLLLRVCRDTDTTDLVTAVYYTARQPQTRGTAWVNRWKTPRGFHACRGFWSFTKTFGTPAGLPAQYKLINIHLNTERGYPLTETDIYGWQFRLRSLHDHTALLFAHELHHFRRYHLNLHPRQGEQAANRWALERMRGIGREIEAEKLPAARKKKRYHTRKLFDPYKKFRPLKAGDRVVIHTDRSGRYTGQTALTVRPIRPQSKRMVVRTSDGKTWRWPLVWLSLSD